MLEFIRIEILVSFFVFGPRAEIVGVHMEMKLSQGRYFFSDRKAFSWNLPSEPLTSSHRKPYTPNPNNGLDTQNARSLNPPRGKGLRVRGRGFRGGFRV